MRYGLTSQMQVQIILMINQLERSKIILNIQQESRPKIKKRLNLKSARGIINNLKVLKSLRVKNSKKRLPSSQSWQSKKWNPLRKLIRNLPKVHLLLLNRKIRILNGGDVAYRNLINKILQKLHWRLKYKIELTRHLL